MRWAAVVIVFIVGVVIGYWAPIFVSQSPESYRRVNSATHESVAEFKEFDSSLESVDSLKATSGPDLARLGDDIRAMRSMLEALDGRISRISDAFSDHIDATARPIGATDNLPTGFENSSELYAGHEEPFFPLQDGSEVDTVSEEDRFQMSYMNKIASEFSEESIDQTWSLETENRIVSVLADDNLGGAPGAHDESSSRHNDLRAQLTGLRCKSTLCGGLIMSENMAHIALFQEKMITRLSSIVPSIRFGVAAENGGNVSMQVYMSREGYSFPR